MKLKTPRLSVVIPSYRQSSTVQALLESLALQDHPDFEVIVVDSSADETTEIIRNYLNNSSLDASLITLAEKSSAGRQRSVGIERARAPWIFTTDTDCVLPKHHLSSMMKKLEEIGSLESTVLGGSIINGTLHSAFGSASYWTEFSDFSPTRPHRENIFVPSANLLFSRHFAQLHGGFADMRVSDDLYTLTLWLRNGAKIHFVPELGVIHNNRTQALRALKHQFLLGQDAAHVRLLVGGKGAWLLRTWPLWPALPFWRLFRVSVRVLAKATMRERVLYLAYLPANFLTLVVWSAGFVSRAARKLRRF